MAVRSAWLSSWKDDGEKKTQQQQQQQQPEEEGDAGKEENATGDYAARHTRFTYVTCTLLSLSLSLFP